jgi:nucleotide-binding universal stress UspA family protein
MTTQPVFGRILVPIEESQQCERALALALALAGAHAARVVFCHAVAPPSVMAASGYAEASLVGAMESADDESGDEARAVLEAAAARARASGLEAEIALVEGEPVASIIALAKSHDIDLIVMATHGRRGLERLMVGSVTEEVVRRSDVPVLVVRSP